MRKMLTCLKLFMVALLFIQILTLSLNIPLVLLAAFELIVLVKVSSVKYQYFIKKNILIISFSFFFGLFAVISGFVTNEMNIKKITETTIKIVFIFNCIYTGTHWIGRKGILKAIDSLPSNRLFIFIILFIKNFDFLIRTHLKIIYSLKSRLSFTNPEKLIVARYYFSNLIHKELYAFNKHQAAFYTRLSGDRPMLYVESEDLRLSDIAVILCILAGYSVSIFI